MTDTQSRPERVTEVGCIRIEMMRDKGMSDSEIAEQINRDPMTVRRHADHACRHYVNVASASDDIRLDDVVEAVRELAESLDPTRIPSERDWQSWPGRPCTVQRAKNEIGGDWTAVLQAAGFPPVHSIAPMDFRRLAYGLDFDEWQPWDIDRGVSR